MSIRATANEFVKLRVREFYGLCLIFIAGFLAVSFLSYNSFDPSFNITSNDEVRNFAGRPGAYIADPLLQFFGIACFTLVLAPLMWGIKLFRSHEAKFIWFKFSLMILSLLAFSMLLSAADTSEGWPFQSYGGYLGYMMHEKIAPYISAPALHVSLALFGLITLYFSLGFSMYDWAEVLLKLGNIMHFAYAIAELFVKKFIKLVKHGNMQVESPVLEKLKKRQNAKTRLEPKISRSKAVSKSIEQASFDLRLPDDFDLPSLDFLSLPPKVKKNTLSESALQQNAKLLEQVLDDFGVNGKITRISPGPVVTLYELEPSPGTKSSRVVGLADDIARSMSATSTRIAVIPGKNAIGIELPNASRETVYLRELLETEEFKNSEYKLTMALGKNIAGEPIMVDLSRMPHLLVAGTTGSGKSVAINTMILSLLYRLKPSECKFIMIDPKMLELSMYDGIPHLMAPVVTDSRKAIVALKWVVKEMENRYRLMSNLGVRNVSGYNKKIETALKEDQKLSRSVQTGYNSETGEPIIESVPLNMEPLPYIVVIVDEMADLMIVAGKEIETSIQRLAQMARAAGIHIIMATQRPSVDVITGVIKANLPTRISFQVTSRIDSRTILGEQGAEQLLGMGDMLYMSTGGRVTRVHGPFVDDNEVEDVVNFLKKQGAPTYMEEITTDEEDYMNFPVGGAEGEGDDLYRQAVQIVIRERKASTSFVQRALRIGYNRAANIIERMEKEGIVGPANHVGKREILLESAE